MTEKKKNKGMIYCVWLSHGSYPKKLDKCSGRGTHNLLHSEKTERRGRGRKRTGKRRSNQGKDMVVIKGN